MAKPIPVKWVDEGTARTIIARTLGYGSPCDDEPIQLLYDALRDGDLKARLIPCTENSILWDRARSAPRSCWIMDSRRGRREIRPSDEDCIFEIDYNSLSSWLAGRRKQHRPRGTGYQKADAPFVDEMAHLRRENCAKSWTDAANQVIKRHGKRVPGTSPEAIVHRLVRRAKKQFDGE